MSMPGLDGELRFDEATRRAAADDFGHLVHRAPEAVLLAASGDDVAKTIRWAGRRGLEFAARGNSHSTFGRSQVEHGVVADVSRLRDIGAVEGDRIVVGAGAKWSEVLGVTLAQGMTPPVLTDYLELSVGGTLVVGGVGGTTSAFGAQADNVIEIEVVTGTGETIACSAEKHPHLFDAVRAGLGQVGVITQATLKLVPAPESVRRFLLAYPDLGTMLADARALAGDDRFSAVQGAIRATPGNGFDFRLDVARYFDGEPPDDSELLAGLSDDAARREPTTIGYRDYLYRLAPLEAAMRANGQWYFPHPWLMTFIGDRQVESLVTPSWRRWIRRSTSVRSARSCSPRSGRPRSPARCSGCRPTRCPTPSTWSASPLPTTAAQRGASSRPTRRSTGASRPPAARCTRERAPVLPAPVARPPRPGLRSAGSRQVQVRPGQHPHARLRGLLGMCRRR